MFHIRHRGKSCALAVLVSVCLAALAPSSAAAQALAEASAPAEFPPASYEGLQYVDSRGCAYVRAGVDGAVTWVPRVTRQRQVICGLEPTFAQTVADPTPVVPDEQAEAEVEAVAADPETTAVPRPSTESKTAAPAEPKLATAKPPAKSGALPGAAPEPLHGLRFPDSACPEAPASSQPYINSGEMLPVRCGPQSQKPQHAVTATVGRKALPDPVVPEGFTFVRPTPTLDVSAGLVPVWKDGRLNPNRGLPGARPATVSAKNTPSAVASKSVPASAVALATRQRPSETVSPKVVAVRAPAPAVRASGRYVQVATFGVPANAQRTAQRLQSMGLPVRVGQITKSGRKLQIVLTGPFGAAEDVRRALAAAKSAGFGDAFMR